VTDHDHDHETTYDELRQALTAEFWDERYAGTDRHWSGRPNQRLVEQVTGLPPGRALDIGCGEGADAIWLAEQGWRVMAVDVSTVALDRTSSHAIQRDVAHRVEVGVYDAMTGEPPLQPAAHDLVTAHFLHVPRPDFDDVYGRIAAAVAPGGRLLVVAHHPDDVESGARRPHGPGLLFPPEQVLAALGADVATGDWEVEEADAPTRDQPTEEGSVRVRDTVVRLRRR
jgi:2-polyprenyl-3-methyl-5-hydroxy-6-metoxy-1,4-benzoquinol methylase